MWLHGAAHHVLVPPEHLCIIIKIRISGEFYNEPGSRRVVVILDISWGPRTGIDFLLMFSVNVATHLVGRSRLLDVFSNSLEDPIFTFRARLPMDEVHGTDPKSSPDDAQEGQSIKNQNLVLAVC